MATASPIPGDASTAEQASADLLVLATAMPQEQFEGVLAHLAEAFSTERVMVAAQDELAAGASTPLRVVPVPRTGGARTLNPIDFINAYEIGREHEARAVLMLGPGSDSLSPLALRTLADAVLNAVCDLVDAMLHASSQYRPHQFGNPVSADTGVVCCAGAISACPGCGPFDAHGGTAGREPPGASTHPTRTTRCYGR